MRRWSVVGGSLILLAVVMGLTWPWKANIGGREQRCPPALFSMLTGGDTGTPPERERREACNEAGTVPLRASFGIGLVGVGVIILETSRHRRPNGGLPPDQSLIVPIDDAP